ncbi:MAG: WS/DGAT/MGAT family O-acyltransferase [Myxococcota bacterium]
MAFHHYDRLSALDTTFLEIEDANVHMHVAAVALFEAEPLRGPNGLDMERIRGVVDAALADTPRFRQKLARIPLFDHPVWIDDSRFNLDYHVRHTALPAPGDLRQLKRLAGRVLSQKLDRSKPMWEAWVVEGVEGDRVALVVKAHHCMVDGISGLDLVARMLSLEPVKRVAPPPRWIPRPAPDGVRLLADETWRRASFPIGLAREVIGSLGRPLELVRRVREQTEAFVDVVRSGLEGTSATPLNADIGPYRRFDWTRHDLEAIRRVRSRFGVTLNDVVLAAAAGAIGRFLEQRGMRTADLRFRAQVPVNTRGRDDRGVGNQVVMLMADLPVGERDPVARLKRVHETMQGLKKSRLRAGIQLLEDLGDNLATTLWIDFARLATSQRTFNIVITNIPGPPRPVYLLESKMESIYPLVPLASNQALGIALFSYAGGLHWGFHADWDALPDLHEIVVSLDEKLEQLVKLAADSTPASEPVAG